MKINHMNATIMAWYDDWSTVDYVRSTIVSIFVTVLLTWMTWTRRPQHSPPGTNGIPFIGVLLSMGVNLPERIMEKWFVQYGPLYMVKFGFTDVVVISSPEIANEAFAKNDCFNDRPDSVPMFAGKGLIFTDHSDFNKEQRRFGLNTLRDFGMGRRSLEPKLIDISTELCEKIDEACGNKGKSNPIDLHPFIYETISSIISCILFGHDVGKENADFRQLIADLTKPAKEHKLMGIMVFAPFLRHFPIFSKAWESSFTFGRRFKHEILKVINEHKLSRDVNEPRDFMDCFLNEIERAKNLSTSGPANDKSNTSTWQNQASEESESCDYSSSWKRFSSFTTDQLVAVIRDLFTAGTDTTAITLLWILLFSCKYPEAQKKMQEEIDDVLGHSGTPRIAIMEKFPYVRAVIQEVTRLRPIVPLNVPHKASRNASLNGYRIPKGAIILTNIWAIHHDPTLWREPEKFLPERHLDADGNFVKSKDWMIFSVGARSCLGQQLAKMELFISTVMMYRRFRFTFPEGTEPNMDGENVVSLRPHLFKVIAHRR